MRASRVALLSLVAAAGCSRREPVHLVLGDGPTEAYAPGSHTTVGAWDVELDPALGTARRFVGGEPMATTAEAALAFVRAHEDLLPGEWTVDGEARLGDLWTIQLAQQHAGVPVLSGHLGLTVNHGRLVLVQGTVHRVLANTEPDIAPASAFASVDAVLAPSTDASDDARLVILPRPGADRLAWEVTSHRADRDIVAYVDANAGGIVAAYDARAYDYPGAITSEVDPRTVGDPIISDAGAFQHARAGGATATSNENGVFAFPASVAPSNAPLGGVTVTAAMTGPYASVRNARGPQARYHGTIRSGQPAIVGWNDTNSRADERDAFRGTNVTNRYVATVFPDNKWIAGHSLVANVNLAWTCNAYWDGKTINFFREGDDCNNTARIFDVVAHEWGHGLDQNAPGGVQDRALGEFIGDLVSFVQTRDAKLGPGFFTNGGAVRDLEDPAFACYDPKKTEVHDAGQFLGAIVWDIHQDMRKLGLDGEQLKRLLVFPIAVGQTRSQWYSAMLAVDDDDGNLANGTPHECLIYDRFEQHSCKGARYPGIPAQRPSHCPKR